MNLFLFKIFSGVIDYGPLPKAGLSTCDANNVCTNNLIPTVLNFMFGLLAAVAFISIVYGGFKYVISQGDPGKTAKAKDIILYSVIGLGISLSAFGAVNLFIKVITK